MLSNVWFLYSVGQALASEQAITPEEISALPTKCNVVDDDDGSDDDDAATSTADDDADDDASD